MTIRRKSILALGFFGLTSTEYVTDTGSPLLIPPPQPYVMRFGGGQVAVAPSTPLLNLGSQFTLEAWIYLEAPTPFGMIVGKRLESDPFVAYALDLGPSGRRVEFAQSTGQPGSYRSVTAPSDLPFQEWTHVAATVAGSVMRLFVNGMEVASGHSPGSSPGFDTVPFSIGGATSATHVPLGVAAVLRQIRVWSRALGVNELASNAVRPLLGREPGLVAAWPLDDGTGQSASDIGPNQLSLQMGLSTDLDAEDPLWTHTVVVDSGPYFSVAVLHSSGNPHDGRSLDLGGDGLPDLVATQLLLPPAAVPAPVLAFRNDGQRGFADATSDVFPGQVVQTIYPRHYAAADFNGDRLTDLFIADHGPDEPPYPGGQSRILIQRPGGTLSDETATRVPARLAFTHYVANADIDQDGDIDLYLCNIYSQDRVGPRFLINDGTGHFAEDATRIPASVASLAPGYIYESSILVDTNHDGHPDLVLGSMENQNAIRDAILLNDGTGHFRFAADVSMPPRYGGGDWGTVNISAADLDGDGLSDLLLAVQNTYRQAGLQLLLNNGDGAFRDETARIPQEWPRSVGAEQVWIKWVMPIDANGDGMMDFVTTGNNLPAHLYLNVRNAHFIDASEILPVSGNLTSVLAEDVDGDRRPDLVMLNGYGGTDYFVRNVKAFDPNAPRLLPITVRRQSAPRVVGR
jgi:Concanavalin A-like lectin/glucanases superfamily/FG-GAP-like repeat